MENYTDHYLVNKGSDRAEIIMLFGRLKMPTSYFNLINEWRGGMGGRGRYKEISKDSIPVAWDASM